MSFITINGISLNLDSLTKSPPGPTYVVVQYNSDISLEDKTWLKNAGFTFKEYVGNKTHLCSFNRAGPPRLSNANSIPNVFLYDSRFKLPAELSREAKRKLEKFKELDSDLDEPRTPAMLKGRESICKIAFAVVLHEDELAIAHQIGAAVENKGRDIEQSAGYMQQVGGELARANITVSPVVLNLHMSSRVVVVEIAIRSEQCLKLLDDIAQMNEVFALESLPKFEGSMNLARDILRVDQIQSRYTNEKRDQQSGSNPRMVGGPLCGGGQVVAIADTGLDDGELNYESGKASHPAFGDRIIGRVQFTPQVTGQVQPIDDKGGHGTFMAGCLAGNPILELDPNVANETLAVIPNDSGFTIEERQLGDVAPEKYTKIVKVSPGTNEIMEIFLASKYKIAGARLTEDNIKKGCIVQGVAPKAKLLIITFVWARGMTNLEDLFVQKYIAHEGQREIEKQIAIHSDSWNNVGDNELAKTQLGYGFLTGSKVDKAMWENSKLLICFSAGNYGRTWGDTGAQIGGVGAAKNCITVGATLDGRRTGLDHKIYDPKGGAANPNDLADFSNRGPTRDGRQKPDVVAPGSCVLAPRSLARRAELITASGGFLTQDQLFTIDSGTSVSAPSVAGCAAILREAYMTKNNALEPSGALLKGLLINGTQDLKGASAWIVEKPQGGRQSGSAANVPMPQAPNGLQGFGRVNVEQSLRPILATDGAQGGILDDIQMELGESRAAIVSWNNAVLTNVALTVTWNDPPAEAVQQFFVVGVVHEAADGKGKLQGADEVQEWRPSDSQRSSEKSSDRPVADNNVQKLTMRNVLPGQVNVWIKCTRTYRDCPTATCTLVWSVSPANPTSAGQKGTTR